jgi:hypothetical protein
MNNTLRDEAWTDELWHMWRDKLAQCSLEQLQKIATSAGLIFTGGNETVEDPDTIIIALDEVSPQDLERAYGEIVPES